MKKKYLTLLIVLMFFLQIYNIVAKEISLSTDEWPPYEFYNSKNEVTGFSTEIIKDIFNNMDIENIDIKIYPWSRAVKTAFSGEVDALYTGSKTEEREKYLNYPEENILLLKWVFIVRNEDKEKIKYNNFKDFDNYKIGVIKSYAYNEEFWDYLKSRLDFDSEFIDDNLIKLLNFKRIDIICCELNNYNYLIKKLNLLGKFTVLEKTLKEEKYYIAFNKKSVNQNFVKKFSENLSKYKKTDKYKLKYKKYFE